MTPAYKVTDDTVKALHIVYCECTNNSIGLTLRKMDAWRLWAAQGWTTADLRLVIRYIQKCFYKKNEPHYMRSMLHFDTLIERDLEKFELYLCDARADARNARPAPDQRSQALSAIGRTEPEKPAVVKTPETILKAGYQNLMKEAGL